MSRVIKFRAWNKVDKNGMIDLKKITPLALDSSLSINGLFLPFDDNIILMQFTGLLDKNGKEIYEGDIIKTGTDKNMVIGWSERFASYVIMRDGWAFQHWFGEAFESSDCEVIGNIHQNPELL